MKSSVLIASFAAALSLSAVPASASVAPSGEEAQAASIKIVAYTEAPVRTQPYGSSHKIGSIKPGSYIYIQCGLQNSYGNYWYRTGSGHYTYSAHYFSYPGIPAC
ncbi:hypothetical protein [Streptomonospora wellingtoniae]|uniref:SH3 domain-containing protein n=1 Tax=Streptomonospora wellingtoniae TaxID=3075544 RepID=A0ABU2KT48_9ACTN|nr:hypothetical protein [Streptomonospora sp. DSM 45055]MDT0302465.1 hypothetical protein [Streptomonospora sp. DSM 45055]